MALGNADGSPCGHSSTALARGYQDAARPRAPLRIAPSIVAGQPVAVHAPLARRSGARSPGRGRSAGRAGPARERRRGLPAHPRPEKLGGPEPLGRAPRRMSSTSSRPRVATSSGTPLETTVRYWPRSGAWPVSRPRSKTQCAGLPSKRGERRAEQPSVEEQMDAHDRRVLELRRRLAEKLGRSRQAEAPPRRRRLRPARRRRAPRRRPRGPPRARRCARPPPLLEARAPPRLRASPRAARSEAGGRSRSRAPSIAVCTVKSPSAALASSLGRFSAGRMKTSQKRSIAVCDWPSRRRSAPKVSPS